MPSTAAAALKAPHTTDAVHASGAVHAHAARSVISRPSSPHTCSTGAARVLSSEAGEYVLGSRHSAPAANSYVSNASNQQVVSNAAAGKEQVISSVCSEVGQDAPPKPPATAATSSSSSSSSNLITATILPPPALALVSSALLASGGGPPATLPAAGHTNGTAGAAGNTAGISVEAAALTSAVAASKLGLVDQLRAALSSHDNLVNLRDAEGRTCLHYAAGYGNEECVDLLLSKTADTSAQDCNGDVPLHFAAIHGHPMCAYNIGKAGCGACLIKNSRGQTPVDVAVACERGEVLNAMLLACAGDTAEVAVRAMRTLLKDGAVPDTWAPNGSSALMLAASVDATQALQVLLEAGASIELQDALGRSALMFAAGNCAHSALVALLDAGACMSLRDRRGRSVLDYAPESSEVRTTLQARLSALEAVAQQRQHDLLASLISDAPASTGSKSNSGGSTGGGRGSSKSSSKGQDQPTAGTLAKKSKASRRSAATAGAAVAADDMLPLPASSVVGPVAGAEADLVCTVVDAEAAASHLAGASGPCICSHTFECDSDIGSCLLSGEDGDPTGWQVVEHKGHSKRQGQTVGSTTTHSQLQSRCHSNASLASTMTTSTQGVLATPIASPRQAAASRASNALRPAAGDGVGNAGVMDGSRGRLMGGNGLSALRPTSPASSTRSHASHGMPKAGSQLGTAGVTDNSSRRALSTWATERPVGCPAVTTTADSMVRQGSGHSLSSLGSCDSHPYSHTSSSSFGTASMRHSHMSGTSVASHASHLATIPSSARLTGMDGCSSPGDSSQPHNAAHKVASSSPSEEVATTTAATANQELPAATTESPNAASNSPNAASTACSSPAVTTTVLCAAATANAWASRKPMILPPAPVAPATRPNSSRSAAGSTPSMPLTGGTACNAAGTAALPGMHTGAAARAPPPPPPVPRSWATIATGGQSAAPSAKPLVSCSLLPQAGSTPAAAGGSIQAAPPPASSKPVTGVRASHSPQSHVTGLSSGSTEVAKAHLHASSKAFSPRNLLDKDEQHQSFPAGKPLTPRNSVNKDKQAQNSPGSKPLTPRSSVSQEEVPGRPVTSSEVAPPAAAIAAAEPAVEPTRAVGVKEQQSGPGLKPPADKMPLCRPATAVDAAGKQMKTDPAAALDEAVVQAQSSSEQKHGACAEANPQLAALQMERDALAKRVCELEQKLAAAKDSSAAEANSASQNVDHGVADVHGSGSKHGTQHGAGQENKAAVDDKSTMMMVQQAVYAERLRIVMHLLSVGMTPSALVTLLSPLGNSVNAAPNTASTAEATPLPGAATASGGALAAVSCPPVKAPVPSKAASSHSSSGGGTPADPGQVTASSQHSSYSAGFTGHNSGVACTANTMGQDVCVSTPVAGLQTQGMPSILKNTGPVAVVAKAATDVVVMPPENNSTEGGVVSVNGVEAASAPKTAAEVAAAVRASVAQRQSSNTSPAASDDAAVGTSINSTSASDVQQTVTKPRTAAEAAAAHASARHRQQQQQQRQAASNAAGQLSELDLLECLNQICRPAVPAAAIQPAAAAVPTSTSALTSGWDMFHRHSMADDLNGLMPLPDLAQAAPSYLSMVVNSMEQAQRQSEGLGGLLEDSSALERAPTLALGCGVDSIAAAAEAMAAAAGKTTLGLASAGPVAQADSSQQPGSNATLPDCGDISVMLAMSDDDDDELPDLAAALAKESGKPASGKPHKGSKAASLPPRPNAHVRRSLDMALPACLDSTPIAASEPPLRSANSVTNVNSVNSPFAFPCAQVATNSPSLPGSHRSGSMSGMMSSAPVSIPAAQGPSATVFAAPTATPAAWSQTKPQDAVVRNSLDAPGIWSVPGGILGGVRPSLYNSNCKLADTAKSTASLGNVPGVLAAGLRSEPGISRNTGSWLDSGPIEPASGYSAWLETPTSLTAASMPEAGPWSASFKRPCIDSADTGLLGAGCIVGSSGAPWSITTPARQSHAGEGSEVENASASVHKPVGAWFAAHRSSAPTSSKPAGTSSNNSVVVKDGTAAPLVSVLGFQSDTSATPANGRSAASSTKPSLPPTPKSGLSSAVSPRSGSASCSTAPATPEAARADRPLNTVLSTSDVEVDPSVMMACRSGAVSPFGTSPMTQPALPGSSPVHAMEAALSRCRASLSTTTPAGASAGALGDASGQPQVTVQRPYSPTRHIAMFQADADPLSSVRKEFADKSSRRSMDGGIEQQVKPHAWVAAASWNTRRNSGAGEVPPKVPNAGVGLASFRAPWVASATAVAATRARDLLMGGAGSTSKASNVACVWALALPPTSSIPPANGAQHRRSTGSTSPDGAGISHMRHSSDSPLLPGSTTASAAPRGCLLADVRLPDCL